MTVNRAGAFVLMTSLVTMAAPLHAASPRQLLAEAAFQAHDKAVALGQIAEAERGAAAASAAWLRAWRSARRRRSGSR
jgi:hypothetical protein